MASATGPPEGASARNLSHSTLAGREERASVYLPSPQCPIDCTGCEQQVGDSETLLGSERPLQGGSLVVAAICYFLLPLAAALIGALLVGEGALRQLAGAGGGLLAATVAAVLIAGILQRRWSEGP